jgi:diaminopimelate decarboxylase
MQAFQRRNGTLFAEDVSLPALAQEFGTPCYVYSRNYIESAYSEFVSASTGRKVSICYALKANSNLAVIECLAQLGAGFDIVSGGELERVRAIGGDLSKVVFSGVGKSVSEIDVALAAGVKCFNVESEAELIRLNARAQLRGVKAPISLRVNPDVDAKTHPYISTGLRENKFGIAFDRAMATYQLAASLPHLQVEGIDCHIGSQITQIEPYLDALEKLLALTAQIEAAGIPIHHLDLGGGLGIRYQDENPPSRHAMLSAIFARVDQFKPKDAIEIMFEFGRSIVGNAGVLLTTVEYLKPTAAKNFAIVDAAMNDLIRPTLYDAWHGVEPLVERSDSAQTWDVVGPVCESGDWLARNRELALEAGDQLAIMSAGAYGMAQASNYNTRTRGAEIMVDGADYYVVREREVVRDLFQLEKRLPKGRAKKSTPTTAA